jgi:hypothetical protein
MTRKKIYELNEKELEENINHPVIQKVIKFANSFNQNCETLFDVYFACIELKNLLEIEIEVSGND